MTMREPTSQEPKMSSDELRRRLAEMDQELKEQERHRRGFLGFEKNGFFNFGSFWSSTLVKLLFLAGLILFNGGMVLGVVGRVIGVPIGFDIDAVRALLPDAVTGVGEWIGILIGWVFVNVIWRIACELVLLPFRVYEMLAEMNGSLARLSLTAASGHNPESKQERPKEDPR